MPRNTRKQCNDVLADRGDFKMVLKKIAQCFPSGIMQFLNQHTSNYQKRSKHFVCTRFPGSSMFCIGWQPDYMEFQPDTVQSRLSCPSMCFYACIIPMSSLIFQKQNAKKTWPLNKGLFKGLHTSRRGVASYV